MDLFLTFLYYGGWILLIGPAVVLTLTFWVMIEHAVKRRQARKDHDSLGVLRYTEK